MRFSVIFVILFYSQILCQSSIYVKYKTQSSKEEHLANISNIIERSNVQSGISNSNQVFSLKSFKEIFPVDNSILENIVKVEVYDNQLMQSVLNILKNDPNVEYVQQAINYMIDYLPNDSLYSEQWGLQNINAQAAWDLIPSDSEEIILAVIDTGIDFLHPDIDDVIFKNLGEIGIDQNGFEKSNNGIDDDANGFIDDFQGWDFVNKVNIFPIETKDDFTDWDNVPMDEHGHGTNMAGIIGAEHNSIGIAGINPKIKILNLRAFDKNGNGEEDDAASAIIYAVQMGAKVINMSWGDSEFSYVLRDVIKYAYDNGAILIGSSGNNSSNEPHFPSGFSEVISVGAIQENESVASFSNYGSTLDLVAPGSQIMTLGLNDSYKKVSGTSAAAPFVSAAVSLIESIEKFNNEEIKQILKSTAKDLGEQGWDESYGAGSLNLEKALKLLSPSEIKINSPKQNYFTIENELSINISCLTPYFKSYELFYGIGNNPTEWTQLLTGKENYQIFNEDVYALNTSQFVDTSYTIRLKINRIDGNTQEERINFGIDRSAPKIISNHIFIAILNDVETVQASVITNDLTTANLFYRELNSSSTFHSVSLNGFVGDIEIISQKHFGVLPVSEVLGGINHEFYIEVKNQSGLTTIIKNDDGENFILRNSIEKKILSNIKKDYSLPNGRILSSPANLSGINGKFIFLNENNSSADLSIYKFDQNKFDKVETLQNKIPVSVGDFNKDGKSDILNLFVKNGFIDTQIEIGDTNFTNAFTDTSETFWPSFADDIDSDGRIEIMVFSSDTSITIWETDNDFNLIKESELENFATNIQLQKSTFRNNVMLVNNFDSDIQNEIVLVDDLGRLVVFQVDGHSSYSDDKIIEHFTPAESNSTISSGDFNGDGIKDIAILSEFEENPFTTPLIYFSVISINESGFDYLFQNMLVTTETNFIGKFEKQYSNIKLSDIDNDGKDNLIVFSYPNSYIFEYGEEKIFLNYYQSDVNSQSTFAGDLDNNGITEIGIPEGNNLFFHEFVDDALLSPPNITDFYSLDSQSVFITWSESEQPVYIYKGKSVNEISLYDSTFSNSYIDSVESNVNVYYTLKFYDKLTKEINSHQSKTVEIFSHSPAKYVKHVVLNNRSIQIFFSNKINTKETRRQNFLIDDLAMPNSVKNSSEYSYLITLDDSIKAGNHFLSIINMRDFYNSPIIDTTLYFELDEIIEEENKLFVSNYSIVNNNALIVSFNFNLDTATSLNKNNYIFTPNNNIITLDFYQSDKNSILLTTQKPFGAIGKEYVLKIENLISSVQSGSLPISQNSGSKIILTSNAENLDDIFVYPNPVRLNNTSSIIFANLTTRVDIHIFSIDGKFIKKISENDGNGGVEWDMVGSNEKIISSGIYFYKALALDNFGNTLQEKIGKFAVIN